MTVGFSEVCVETDRDRCDLCLESMHGKGRNAVFDKAGSAFYRDRDMYAAERSGCQQGLCLCIQVHMVIMLVDMQLVQAETYGVGCKSSGDHEAVYCKADPVAGGPSCVQLAVEGHPLDVDKSEKRVLAVCIYDVRMICKPYPAD